MEIESIPAYSYYPTHIIKHNKHVNKFLISIIILASCLCAISEPSNLFYLFIFKSVLATSLLNGDMDHNRKIKIRFSKAVQGIDDSLLF